jgi:ATP-dependent Lon protease
MTTRGQTATVPVIPLPKGIVLFPGMRQRIVISPDRPDLAALLAHIYSHDGPSKKIKHDAISIACVPMASPFLGRRGQLLLPVGTGERPISAGIPEFNADTSRRSDLFGCGVAAKITAVQGQTHESGEVSFVVHGQSRILVDDISQERPFFQGKVTWYHDEGKCASCPSISSRSVVAKP